MTAKIFNNIFTHSEIDHLINFYSTLPIANTKHYPNGDLVRHIKHSVYDRQDQVPYKIINSKLTAILGDHSFTGGHWMDSYSPFRLHNDNISSYNKRGVPVFESPLHQNIGVLIPLCEHEHFQTIFFDYMLDTFEPDFSNDIYSSDESELSTEFMKLVDHHSDEECNHIKKFKLDCLLNWKIGSVLCWPRNQLHCSSNFKKYNLNKQAIVLWL